MKLFVIIRMQHIKIFNWHFLKFFSSDKTILKYCWIREWSKSHFLEKFDVNLINNLYHFYQIKPRKNQNIDEIFVLKFLLKKLIINFLIICINTRKKYWLENCHWLREKLIKYFILSNSSRYFNKLVTNWLKQIERRRKENLFYFYEIYLLDFT
jgi:hypothetical protein